MGNEVVLRLHHEDNVIWGEYNGGVIEKGFLVGMKNDDSLDFDYQHVCLDGEEKRDFANWNIGWMKG